MLGTAAMLALLGIVTSAWQMGIHAAGSTSSPGSAWAWGNNAYGQLGNGTTTNSTAAIAVALPSGIKITAIAGGYGYHSLALTAAGQLLAWGWNASGQLGNGTTTNSTSPIAVSLPPGTTVTAIAGGYSHSLALTSAGQVLAWGDNTYGQLGNGTLTNSTVPIAVSLPPGTIVTAIAVGDYHSLALTASGQELAWGANSWGQLGNGTLSNSPTPVAVSLPSGTSVTAIAGGNSHSLALTSSGQVLAQGNNAYGQLGYGTYTYSSRPVLVSLPSGITATAIAAGDYHSLALTSTGGELAWGYNYSGQLGNGNTSNNNTPTVVNLPSGTTVTAIAGGTSHSLALTSIGQVLAWGSNSSGQLGDGTSANSSTPVVASTLHIAATAIAAGGVHSLAIVATTTTTSVASSLNPSRVGGSVTYTATVLPTPDGGTVAFTDNTTGLGGCSAVAINTSTGKATCTSSYSVAGSHAIVATYSGDTTYAGSNGSLTQSVNAATTTTALGSSPNPSTVGGSVTYTATVLPTPDGGTVAFTDNATTLAGCGLVPINSSTGKATCTTSYSAVGSHAMVANYSGDTNYVSSSGSLTQQVNIAATTTGLASASNPSAVNGSVTYTATVSPTPDSGTVAFTDNAASFSGCSAVTVNTASGNATCTTSYAAAGSHAIVASYSGGTNYAASNGSLTQTVNAATTATGAASSSNPSSVGSNVTYTATVMPTPDGGTVAFTDNGPLLAGCGAVAVNASTGRATCTISYNAAGTHAIVASYSGDTNYAASSGSLIQQINAVTTGSAVFPALSNGAYGGYVTAVTIQNIGTAPAVIRIAYFDQNGAPVGAGDSIGSLPVNASWTVRQDNGNSFPSSGGNAAQAGSAVVYSSQPIASFVNEFPPGNVGDATSYSGVQVPSGVGTTLYAPTIVNNAYGAYTTGIGLLNQGSSPTDVTITYRDGGGAVVKTQTVSALAAHAYQAFYSGDAVLNLPSGFIGSATITSSTTQPLGAIVNETGPGGQFSSYDAVPSGSLLLNAPVALNNAYGGFYTGMAIQNTSGTGGTVSVTYYDVSGTATAKSFPIAANGSLGVYQGSVTDGPAPGAYTAVIQSSTVPLAAIVNETGPAGAGSARQSTSYNTFSAGSAALHLPLVENAGSDPWNTGEGIMNTGTSSTAVTVSYYDSVTGAAIGATQTQTLAPHAFWGLYQPNGGLPIGSRATAVVTTSAGGQVAVICNESSANTFMSYDGQ